MKQDKSTGAAAAAVEEQEQAADCAGARSKAQKDGGEASSGARDTCAAVKQVDGDDTDGSGEDGKDSEHGKHGKDGEASSSAAEGDGVDMGVGDRAWLPETATPARPAPSRRRTTRWRVNPTP